MFLVPRHALWVIIACAALDVVAIAPTIATAQNEDAMTKPERIAGQFHVVQKFRWLGVWNQAALASPCGPALAVIMPWTRESPT